MQDGVIGLVCVCVRCSVCYRLTVVENARLLAACTHCTLALIDLWCEQYDYCDWTVI